MRTHQASHHCLQEAFDLLMHSTTCLQGRKYAIMTHGISPFLARFFFFCKNYPSFFPLSQPLAPLVGINARDIGPWLMLLLFSNGMQEPLVSLIRLARRFLWRELF